MNVKGFTLLEIIVSLALLGTIMVTTFSFINTSSSASSSSNSNNELVREGQIAQQVLAARVKEACYIFPNTTNIALGAGGWSKRNFFSGSMFWIIGADPFIALLLPPEAGATASAPYRFFAYFAMSRNEYVSRATGGNNPGADALNDANTWVLLQFQAEVVPTVANSTCAAISTQSSFNTLIASSIDDADLLLDYVDIPANRNELFKVNPNYVDYDIRLRKTSAGGSVIRIGGPGAQSSL